MWWYTLWVLVFWAIDPELRRVYGFYFGFATIEILAILPIFCLVPYVWSLTYGGGWRRLPRLLAYAAWVWLGGFAYALLLACLSGNVLSGSYDFAFFVLPIGMGLWVAADRAPFRVAYERLTRCLFALATVISSYGIIQYVFAPSWDVAWLDSLIKLLGSTTFGQPIPFGIRVFSTLNSPVGFACFLAMVLLLVLPELSLRKPLLIMQVPIWFIAFALSLVRTGWLMFAVGTLMYLIFTSRRGRLFAALGVTTALIAAVISITPAAIGNDDVITSLSSRIATLSDFESDFSVQSRQGVYDDGPQQIFAAPLGQGLGVLGTATKLTAVGTTTNFDSGILARAYEMGLPGVALYIMSLLILSYSAVRLWNAARIQNDSMLRALAAAAIALIVALAFLQLSLDTNGLLLIVFWLVECLAVRAYAPSEEHRAEPTHLIPTFANAHFL